MRELNTFFNLRSYDIAGNFEEVSLPGMVMQPPQGIYVYDNSITEDQDWTNIDNELSGVGHSRIFLVGLLPINMQ